jgi:hypothetical protein
MHRGKGKKKNGGKSTSFETRRTWSPREINRRGIFANGYQSNNASSLITRRCPEG